MATSLKLVQGDNLPSVTFALYDETIDEVGRINRAPIDLTDCVSSLLKFRPAGSVDPLEVQDVTGTVLSPPEEGRVRFDWTAANLAGPEGNYEGEIELSLLGGGIFTVYDVQKFKVRKQFG
jgi:hypothetical protein